MIYRGMSKRQQFYKGYVNCTIDISPKSNLQRVCENVSFKITNVGGNIIDSHVSTKEYARTFIKYFVHISLSTLLRL